MLSHYLTFWRNHRDTLLSDYFYASAPDTNYSVISAESKSEKITVLYSDRYYKADTGKPCYIINAGRCDELIIDTIKPVSATIFNCFGEKIAEEKANGLTKLRVPVSGLVLLK